MPFLAGLVLFTSVPRHCHAGLSHVVLRGWSGVALHFFFTICFVTQGLKARI